MDDGKGLVSGSSSEDEREGADRVENVSQTSSLNLRKVARGKKLELGQDQVDFEKMSAAERKRMKFKKLSTKAIQPNIMQSLR